MLVATVTNLDVKWHENEEVARIGTAGWSVPAGGAGVFAKEGSQLQRYSARLSCVEINSSFYRPHRSETYIRWAASVPSRFRFAVKTPRAITHEARLRNSEAPLKAFTEQVRSLGSTLGPILIQLPPSLKFAPTLAESFLSEFRKLFGGDIVFEPRHPTWFAPPADELLRTYRVARAAADPAPDPRGVIPGGWTGLRYWRLHGSPQVYFTAYGEERLRPIADQMSLNDWCIFDNTASGAAIVDALLFQRLIQPCPS